MQATHSARFNTSPIHNPNFDASLLEEMEKEATMNQQATMSAPIKQPVYIGAYQTKEVNFATVISLDDLPTVGDANTVYTDLSTMDMYVFKNGEYGPYNPYATQPQLNQAPTNVFIEDDSVCMPHGGSIDMAIMYNVRALREDLRLLNRLGMQYTDVLPKGSWTQQDEMEKLRLKYLKHSHKALYEQLRFQARNSKGLVKEIAQRLQNIGVDIWWDADKHELGFKDGAFVVAIA
jgi:hypothetical protein